MSPDILASEVVRLLYEKVSEKYRSFRVDVIKDGQENQTTFLLTVTENGRAYQTGMVIADKERDSVRFTPSEFAHKIVVVLLGQIEGASLKSNLQDVSDHPPLTAVKDIDKN